MDRIFSARINDAVYRKIGALSSKMHTSKKAIIEQAVAQFERQAEQGTAVTVFDQTFGTWKREETAQETVNQNRMKFRDSMNRYQK